MSPWLLRTAVAALVAVLIVKVPINSGVKLLLVTNTFAIAELLATGPAKRPRLAAGFCLAVFLCFGVVTLTSLDRPFLPLLGVATLAAVILSASSSAAARAVWVNVAVLLGTLTATEAVWSGLVPGIGSAPHEQVVVTERSTGRSTAGGVLSAPDAMRGFAGQAGCAIRMSRSRGGQVLSDVTYTLGAAGRREPPVRPGRERQVLFLGDSLCFGEGVADADTVPAQLEALRPGTATVNLGFKGYGPHQALATLEGRIEERAEPGATYSAAVYFAYADFNRAAGRAPWDSVGPRYVPTGDGGVAYAGAFSSSPRLRAIGILNRSEIMKRIIPRFFVSEKDVDLFARILTKASALFRERYRGRFIVLLWGDGRDRWYARSREALRVKGVEVHAIQEVLPEAELRQGKWTLPDGHPNAAADQRVAEFLAVLLDASASPAP